jgi:hypothetical protein
VKPEAVEKMDPVERSAAQSIERSGLFASKAGARETARGGGASAALRGRAAKAGEALATIPFSAALTIESLLSSPTSKDLIGAHERRGGRCHSARWAAHSQGWCRRS